MKERQAFTREFKEGKKTAADIAREAVRRGKTLFKPTKEKDGRLRKERNWYGVPIFRI